MADPARVVRHRGIYTVHKLLHAALPSLSPRQEAANCVIRMIEAWEEIEHNWSAEDVELADTPEEIAKWETAFLEAGKGILALAQLVVEQEP